jgi:hypothetical protein
MVGNLLLSAAWKRCGHAIEIAIEAAGRRWIFHLIAAE